MSRQSQPVQEYWLPGFGLSKQIVITQLQYFLGPTVTVRPFTYHGREGYMINGIKLTREQIEDLQHQSQQYEEQQARRMSGRTPRAGTPAREAYINEPVVVGPPRRSSPDYRDVSEYSRHRR